MQRREFIKGVAIAGLSARGIAGSFAGAQATQGDQKKGATMIYRTLGRTGERVSAIGMGGFHLGQPKLSDDESMRLIRAAIDSGITFMDNSWYYNSGQSEIR